MEKVLFADTFKKTFKGIFRVPKVVIDDPVFRLHYKATGLALLIASILVSGYQFFGEPILCIQRDDIPEKLLNTYCWVEGTFTLPRALSMKVGTEVAHPGVDKYKEGDEVIEHSYYQWVCFVLFLQAVMFCVPWMIWKSVEGGRMGRLIKELKNPVFEVKERENYVQLAVYFKNRMNHHKWYAYRFLLCEALNFVNVIGQIYFINRFLGGEFTTYGSEVVKFANMEQEDRFDPMIRVFPRVTKCTFHRYGSSGDVQKHDALCLLPLNIINEKVFVIMWFWFIVLALMGGVLLLYRFLVIGWFRARFVLLRSVSSLTPPKLIDSIITNISYGDWFVLYVLAVNIDNVHFREFLIELKKLKEVKAGDEKMKADDEDDENESHV